MPRGAYRRRGRYWTDAPGRGGREWVGVEKDPNASLHAEHAYMPTLLTVLPRQHGLTVDDIEPIF